MSEEETEAGVGHNSGIEGSRLKDLIKQIEDGEKSKEEWSEHIKEIYADVKAVGLDVKTVRRIVKARKADKEKLREQKELLELYAFAIDPELAEVLS